MNIRIIHQLRIEYKNIKSRQNEETIECKNNRVEYYHKIIIKVKWESITGRQKDDR